jgi:hypothetical protein
MALKSKYTFRSWMIMYLSLAAALAAAIGGPDESTDVLGIPATPPPAALSGDTVFFAPAGATTRRNDI